MGLHPRGDKISQWASTGNDATSLELDHAEAWSSFNHWNLMDAVDRDRQDGSGQAPPMVVIQPAKAGRHKSELLLGAGEGVSTPSQVGHCSLWGAVTHSCQNSLSMAMRVTPTHMLGKDQASCIRSIMDATVSAVSRHWPSGSCPQQPARGFF